MRIRRKLLALARTVADEAERNPEFAAKLETELGLAMGPPDGEGTKGGARRRGRRASAAFDPVATLRAEGEEGLRSRLSRLDLEKLRDMVAQYGMDPGKLVMKWKNKDRVVDRIMEMSASRAQKGDAFREDVLTERPLEPGDDQSSRRTG